MGEESKLGWGNSLHCWRLKHMVHTWMSVPETKRWGLGLSYWRTHDKDQPQP